MRNTADRKQYGFIQSYIFFFFFLIPFVCEIDVERKSFEFGLNLIFLEKHIFFFYKSGYGCMKQMQFDDKTNI